jgi:hypothetical protein
MEHFQKAMEMKMKVPQDPGVSCKEWRGDIVDRELEDISKSFRKAHKKFRPNPLNTVNA